MPSPHTAPRLGISLGSSTSIDAVSITTSETELVSAATPLGAARHRLLVCSTDNDWYLGPTGVLSSDGLLVEAKAWVELNGSDTWYGITASGTADVRVLEIAD